MSSPVTPNDFKEIIPSATGNFCEKFAGSLSLGKRVYELVSYIFNEDGTLTDDFKADVCALECMGGDGDPGTGSGFGKPTGVSASDGSHNSQVVVTWSEVDEATEYDIYRNTTNDSGSSTLIGSTSSTNFADTTVVPGTVYYFWVKARNASQTSAFSTPDSGYASTALAEVSDLAASRGMGIFSSPFVSLVFSAVDMATHYDFYMSTTDDFATATLIDSNRTPFDNSGTSLTGPPGSTKPVFINNQTDLVYRWVAPNVASGLETKYFWVVAKTLDGSAVVNLSGESNSAAGWALGWGDGVAIGTQGQHSSGETVDTPAGWTRVWFAFFGAGAGGAGGDGDDGAGGGGGGAVATGWFPVASGSKLRILCAPTTETGRAPASTDGTDGSTSKLQYSANGLFDDTIDVVDFSAPVGGIFTNAGLGAGGTGALVNAVHAVVQDEDVHDGNDGLPAKAAGVGGSGGHRWGSWRARNATGTANVGDGSTLGAGGGANKNAAAPSNAEGGSGGLAFAYLTFR